MATRFSLVALFFALLVLSCFFSSPAAFAAVPKSDLQGWCVQGRYEPCAATAELTCKAMLGDNYRHVDIAADGQSGRCYNRSMNYQGMVAPATYKSCPPNSAEVNGECVCSAGYSENPEKTQCIKDEDVCGPLKDMSMGVSGVESDFGNQNTNWAGSQIGQTANACVSGCQVSGKVNHCIIAGTAVCQINNPVFTGAACSADEEPGPNDDGCPENTILQPVTGLCVPKVDTCPEGQEPSKYVDGICVPTEASNDGKCEDPKDPTKRVECEGKDPKCPSGKVPSKVTPGTCVTSPDGSGKDKDGNTVKCNNGICVTTDKDGNKTEKPQDQVCKENPELEVCKKDKGGLTGACAGGFKCDGDGLQCSIAVEQHRRNCELFEKENDHSKLYSRLLAAQSDDGVLSGTEVDLAGHFAVDSVIGNGVCPSDITLTVMGQSVPVRLSQFCQYFNAMGYLIMLGACISCLRILAS